jgi:hypothetical protein
VILRGADFASLISFLETQGDVHVLSSPRIATLNNQKAVIKVGTEEPFVTSIAPGSTSLNTGASVSVPPTLNYAPFFSGISLDVTPQVDDQDRVTLHVHALVNSIVEKEKPSSTQVGSIPVPLAVNSVNETDSVVKTLDGTMVVIGGLMTESSQNGRSAIPGVGDVPVAGALFRKGSQTSSKRELVIPYQALDHQVGSGMGRRHRRHGSARARHQRECARGRTRTEPSHVPGPLPSQGVSVRHHAGHELLFRLDDRSTGPEHAARRDPRRRGLHQDHR